METTSLELTLQIVIAVFSGIVAQVFAEYLKVPSIVFLLLLGIILGSDGLNLLHPQQLGLGLEVLVSLAVAIILFEGGLSLDLRNLGLVSGSLRNLVTLGTLITFVGGGIAAHYLAEFPWSIALLYASLVVVTGPTVVSPLLKQVKVDRPVATLLEGEGVLADPVGAILAFVVLNTIVDGSIFSSHGNREAITSLSSLISSLVLGGSLGWGGGLLLRLFLKRALFLSQELKNLLVLAAVWGLFMLAQVIKSESGLMTAVVLGLVLGAADLPGERLLRQFKGQLTILGVSVLFILLAADLSIASLFALGWGSLATVLVLMFVVRPISIFLCTWQSKFNWRQKLFLCWVAPRGIVSASVASLFAIILTERGITGGESLKALVFLTIMLTVFLQGLTARWVAQLLQITPQNETGAVIIGCHPLSMLIARLFQERGESVILIDTDQEACQRAIAEDLSVIQSSGLDVKALEEAGLDSMGTFVAMTNNGEVNLVLAQHAITEFKPPRVLAVLSHESVDPLAPNPSGVASAFAPQMLVKTWNQYLTEGQIKLGTTTLEPENFTHRQAHLQTLIQSGELVPLIIAREGRVQIQPAAEEWQPGDEVIYLLHDPRPSLLKLLSGTSVAAPLVLEKLAEVEEIPYAAIFALSPPESIIVDSPVSPNILPETSTEISTETSTKASSVTI